MNSFEYSSTETEQLEIKQTDIQSVTQETASDSIPVSAQGLVDEVTVESVRLEESVEVEAFSQTPNGLAYSCLMIPRFSDHYLAGDIVQDLETWMKEISISYGWRLEKLTIRPGYLQWVVTVPFTTNPAQLMKVTRQQTSQKIFEYYPRFSRKNVALDFWAPGFSVMSGSSPQSAEDIDNFIMQVRRQQGIL